MNIQEYKVWEQDAARALSGRYSQLEIDVVLEWFRHIKGQEERELVGNAAVEGHVAFVAACGNFDVYNGLMSRLFVYAPLILKEHAGSATVPAPLGPEPKPYISSIFGLSAYFSWGWPKFGFGQLSVHTDKTTGRVTIGNESMSRESCRKILYALADHAVETAIMGDDDSEWNRCPTCHTDVTCSVHDAPFQYAHGPEEVTLVAKDVPHLYCDECQLEYTDSRAEAARAFAAWQHRTSPKPEDTTDL